MSLRPAAAPAPPPSPAEDDAAFAIEGPAGAPAEAFPFPASAALDESPFPLPALETGAGAATGDQLEAALASAEGSGRFSFEEEAGGAPLRSFDESFSSEGAEPAETPAGKTAAAGRTQRAGRGARPSRLPRLAGIALGAVAACGIVGGAAWWWLAGEAPAPPPPLKPIARKPAAPAPQPAPPARDGSQPLAPTRQEQYPWVVQQMLAGRTVAISSMRELPAEAAVGRESARLRGIKSSLILPLAVGGQPAVGVLAFNTVQAEREWPDYLVKRLLLVAQVFTNALARRRHELSLQESEARLAAGANLAGLAFYEVDLGAGGMYVDDRLREICGVPPDREQGLRALEFWMEHLHPDDRQRVLDMREQLHDGRTERLSVEYRYLHPTRGELWIDHLAGVADRDGAVAGIPKTSPEASLGDGTAQGDAQGVPRPTGGNGKLDRFLTVKRRFLAKR